MKLVASIFALITVLLQSVSAAQSFAGTNLYYAAGLSSAQQDAYFQKLSDAGIKVLRVWLDGELNVYSDTEGPF